ncbi:AMP-binding protein [Actinomadura rayongensis]|uniref:AMP-binding protein n=1 Tax=Actinomadura rayongensis TaxID=1429076 RepID=A0A6I4WAP6_9ACTN|nr:AMP-binding protein [Actinomadura rayongensis]MXQ66193.1 AMP-binding protein [Actinomadura rayongensis]
MISLGSGGGALMTMTMTMARAVFGAADDRVRGARTAVLDAVTGHGPTHAELAAAVGSAASGLAREGVGPGTVVALHLPDGPEFALALHAVAAAGAVPFPVRVTATCTELSRLLNAAGAQALVTWPGAPLDQVRAAARTVPGLRRVFCFGSVPGTEPFAALLTGGAAPDVDVDAARDTALLVCTRGDGGPARPVPLTHAEVVAGLLRVADAGMIGAADTVLSAVPFADVLALNGLLNPALRLGATVVALPGGGHHDLLRALQDHDVTVALLDPGRATMLAYDRAVSRYRLRLRAIVVTAGPLDARTARALAQRLGCPVRQAYGLAEAGGLTHLNLRAAEECTADSVGRGLPGVSWRVVDPATGDDQSAYQPGELCVRVPAAGDASRWLPAGDSAFADEHGRVFVLGRIGGRRPEPQPEPDAVLAAHPAVRDAAVAPAPDLDLGLVPHAFAVLAEPVPAADLLAYVNAHVPPSRGVAAVHVVDAIPRGPGGRVRRRALLERAGLGS